MNAEKQGRTTFFRLGIASHTREGFGFWKTWSVPVFD
jgi:hypothetical protein